MKEMKFRVYSPEHSEAIQGMLFELGYGWVGSDKEAREIHEPFLFTESDGRILKTNLYPFFDADKSTETTLDDLYKMSKEEPIEEMTLEQVCKELGRTIKIVK